MLLKVIAILFIIAGWIGAILDTEASTIFYIVCFTTIGLIIYFESIKKEIIKYIKDK